MDRYVHKDFKDELKFKLHTFQSVHDVFEMFDQLDEEDGVGGYCANSIFSDS